MLGGIDLSIIIVYFIILTGIGVYFTKKASGSVDEYFLAARSIPWFILGISGVATFIDMSGTMLSTSFFYMLGVKGYWVCWRGAIALFLAFFMIFIGKWLWRSKVMTNAEWVAFRFGREAQGNAARIFSVITTIVLSILMVSYFFLGSGKFLSNYLPFSSEISALILFGIMLIYTVASGFYGVVYTDLFQAVLIVFAIVYIAAKAMSVGTPEYFAKFSTPEWHTITPSWHVTMPPGYENMNLLGLLIIFWIFSNILQGFSAPIDAWTSQRYYAAKDERESSLVAWFWIALLSLRFPLLLGIAVLALGISGTFTDPEMAFPAVFNYYLPVGIKGVLIAALISAQLSSVCTIVNAPAAYFVNDIYNAFIKPKATQKHLVKVSYLSTIAIVVIGIAIGWRLPNINTIWIWIAMGMVTGATPANIFKWFWWRFNGMGYAFGLGGGILGAILSQLLLPNVVEHITFMFVIVVATITSVIGTYLGKPVDHDVLVNFYRKTKPFGFWGPIRKSCEPEFVAAINKENRRDLLLLTPACLWQILINWIMICIVVRKWDSMLATIAVFIPLSYLLYKYWYKNLKRGADPEEVIVDADTGADEDLGLELAN